MLEAQSTHNLSEEEILDEMVTWVMGGHETTASLISWAVYLLHKHTEVKEKVLQELVSVLNIQDNTIVNGIIIPNEQQLQQMEYLNMVLKETLRLYPPAPIINRVAIEDHKIGPYTIPKNTEVLISPWVLQRTDKLWQDPLQFKPERWKEDSVDNFAFLPFSAGPRACLGKIFAYLEAKLIFSIIFQRFAIHVVNASKAEPDFAITLRPKHYFKCKLSKCDLFNR